MKRYLLLLVASTSLLLGCPQQTQSVISTNDKDSYALRLSAENSKQYCSYKDFVNITTQDHLSASLAKTDEEKAQYKPYKVRGKLSLQCNGDYSLVILGPIGIPFATLTQVGGEVEYHGVDSIDIEQLIYFATKAHNEDKLKVPHIQPRADSPVDVDAAGIFILQDGYKIYAYKDSYKVLAIWSEEVFEYTEYSWQKDKPKSVTIYDGQYLTTLDFSKPDSWGVD